MDLPAAEVSGDFYDFLPAGDGRHLLAPASFICQLSAERSQQEQGMEEGHCLIFGPFRLDLTRDHLWREQEAVELRAKPLAVLRYLLEHPGQVVTRGELLKQVWPGSM